MYGLINFEFEYVASPGISLHLSSEYLVTDYIISKENHPDLVLRIGSRYHFFNNKDNKDRNDLYTGICSGYMWLKNNEKQNTIFINGEFGYKYKFNPPVCLNSKLLLTYPLKTQTISPGFECLFGYIW